MPPSLEHPGQPFRQQQPLVEETIPRFRLPPQQSEERGRELERPWPGRVPAQPSRFLLRPERLDLQCPGFPELRAGRVCVQLPGRCRSGWNSQDGRNVPVGGDCGTPVRLLAPVLLKGFYPRVMSSICWLDIYLSTILNCRLSESLIKRLILEGTEYNW